MRVAILHRNRDQAHNEGVGDVLKELEDHAVAVLRLEAEAEKHRAIIRELLPKARAENPRKNGPAKLERTIKSVYVAGTISRWTKDFAAPRGKRGRSQDEPAS